MEKFAVDLDKVLDDFELNEDRAERFATKSKNPPPKLPQPLLGGSLTGHLGSKRDVYSRPEGSERLRRINLVDADFAPDPNPVSSLRAARASADNVASLLGSRVQPFSLETTTGATDRGPNSSAVRLDPGVISPPALSDVVSRRPLVVDGSQLHSTTLPEVPAGGGSCHVPNSLPHNETGVVGYQCSNAVEEHVPLVSPTVSSPSVAQPILVTTDKDAHGEGNSLGNSGAPGFLGPTVGSDGSSREEHGEEGDPAGGEVVDVVWEPAIPAVPQEVIGCMNGSEGLINDTIGCDSNEEEHVPVVESSGGVNEDRPVNSNDEGDLTIVPLDREMHSLVLGPCSSVEEPAGDAEDRGECEERTGELLNGKEEGLEEKNLGEGGGSDFVSSVVVGESVRPVSFQMEEELSDVEFAKYLAELEAEDKGKGVERRGGVGQEEEGEEGGEGGQEEGERVVVHPKGAAEDSREESWVVEGSGTLLESASSLEQGALVIIVGEEVPPPGGIPLVACEAKGGQPAAVVARPDSLSLPGSSVVTAGRSEASTDDSDDESIPHPFVIGPPGATPANPQPPSDIGAAGVMGVEERRQQQTAAPAENTGGSAEGGSLSSDSSSSSNTEEGRPPSPPPHDECSTQAYLDHPTQKQQESPPPPPPPPEVSSLSSSSNSSGSEDQGPKGVVQGEEEGAVGKSTEDSSPDSTTSASIPPSHDLLHKSEASTESGLQSSGLLTTEGLPSLEVPISEPRCRSALALGDVAPFWVPDADAPACMSCAAKFTLIKRRHHCRACGKVLCSKCCSSRARLAYLDHSEARVCAPCQGIIQEALAASSGGQSPPNSSRSQSGRDGGDGSEHSPRHRLASGRPDPNNPMEYCSTVPPLEQVGERAQAPPPSVMVPVGVLKREGSSSRSKGETKQVMFSDGIRPGGELSDLDRSPSAMSAGGKVSPGLSAVQRKIASRLGKRLPGVGPPGPGGPVCGPTPLLPTVGSSYILGDDAVPPMVDKSAGGCNVGLGGGGIGGREEYNFEEGPELDRLMETLSDESEPPVAFALSKNFFVLVKIITLDCCVNRVVWSFTTRGMRCVGQDEVVVLLEWLPSDKGPPRDIFCHLGALYEQAAKGNTVTELGHSTVQGMFLGSRDHGGFLYIRATFQCLRRLPLPPPPYLFGLLLHRMETPWAKVFPIRVMLRLGAEFRYYPCPLVGIRGRGPVYHQIGHTIMNLLSDFRNFAYILPSVRGMVIHMEERQTSILLPRNRLSQVERAVDDSDDHVLALAASFSSAADSHLVCVQGESGDASTGSSHYHTQAINIQNKPRKVTGASFVVFNGALKPSAKLTAKSSIVEDGLMVQVLPDTLTTLRNALRNGEDFVIPCGPVSPSTVSRAPAVEGAESGSSSPNTQQPTESPPVLPDEVVIICWVDDDKNFNIGVKSPIDGMPLDGVPSIRVHNGTNYVSDTKFIRWTEVFLIQSSETVPPSRGDTMDVSRISESIAHAVCLALHPYLDLLWSHSLTLIAVRATLGPDSEGYEAGCGGSRLPPIYMNGLDNELVGVLHRIESRPQEGNLVLELLFHLMEL